MQILKLVFVFTILMGQESYQRPTFRDLSMPSQQTSKTFTYNRRGKFTGAGDVAAIIQEDNLTPIAYFKILLNHKKANKISYLAKKQLSISRAGETEGWYYGSGNENVRGRL